MEQNTYAAIEIGEYQTKVVALNYYANRLALIASGVIRSQGISNGDIVSKKEIATTISLALSLLKEQGVNVDQILVVLPAKKLNIYQKTSFINVANQVVSARDVKELIHAFSRGATPLDDTIVNIIPLEYILDDNKKVKDSPVGLTASNIKFYCYIATLPTYIARGYVDCVLDHVEVADALVSPLAQCEMILAGAEKSAIIIDIGGYNTVVSRVSQGKVVASSSIRFGGQVITEAIAKEFNLEVSEAERIKRKYGNANVNQALDIDLQEAYPLNELKLAQVIKGKLDDLIREINRTITSFNIKENIPIYLTGGGSMLSGIDEQIKTFFNVNIEVYRSPLIGARSNEFTSSIGIISHYIKQH